MANSITYTDEFRVETADYVISTGQPITEVSKELDLNDKTVQRWVKKRRDQLDGRAPTKQESDELRAAQKRIRELEKSVSEDSPLKPFLNTERYAVDDELLKRLVGLK